MASKACSQQLMPFLVHPSWLRTHQGELYLLSQPGGPRYAPRRVNKLAGEVLDALFPAGRWVLGCARSVTGLTSWQRGYVHVSLIMHSTQPAERAAQTVARGPSASFPCNTTLQAHASADPAGLSSAAPPGVAVVLVSELSSCVFPLSACFLLHAHQLQPPTCPALHPFTSRWDFLSRTATAVRAWFMAAWAALVALCMQAWRPAVQLRLHAQRRGWR